MIDIKQIREEPEKFEKAAKDKLFDVDIHELLRLDRILRDTKRRLQDISTEKNSISKSIPNLSGDKKQAALEKLSRLKKDESTFQTRIQAEQPKFEKLMYQVPQPADDDVPFGLISNEV
jgi:seryl-tRNA synthetase